MLSYTLETCQQIQKCLSKKKIVRHHVLSFKGPLKWTGDTINSQNSVKYKLKKEGVCIYKDIFFLFGNLRSWTGNKRDNQVLNRLSFFIYFLNIHNLENLGKTDEIQA